MNIPRADGADAIAQPDITQWDGRWYFAQVRPKDTMAVAWRLVNEFGLQAFAPLGKDRRPQGGMIRDIVCPKFPGYIFAALRSDNEWYELRRHPRIFGEIQRIKDAEQFVREIARFVEDLRINPYIGTVPLPEAGRKVRIIRGPFAAVHDPVREGIVVRHRVNQRFQRVTIFIGPPAGPYDLEVESSDIEVVD